MPIYVYKCPLCGLEKELLRSLSNRPEKIKCDCMDSSLLYTLMPLKISSGSFVINGFNEKNGYSKK